jgi:hypothetical protein
LYKKRLSLVCFEKPPYKALVSVVLVSRMGSVSVTPKNGGQEIPMFLEALPGTPIKNDPLAFMNIVPEGKTTDAFWP